MKILLLGLLISGSVFANGSLSGDRAEDLFNSLPKELFEIGPGAVSKSAVDVSCIAYPNRGNSTYRCEMRKIDGSALSLDLHEAEELFNALPIELIRMKPGSIFKNALEVNCFAYPNRGDSIYHCEIVEKD